MLLCFQKIIIIIIKSVNEVLEVRINAFAIVTSIVVEQGCFQTELRIAGNSNKLIYFRKITSRIYSTKLLQI